MSRAVRVMCYDTTLRVTHSRGSVILEETVCPCILTRHATRYAQCYRMRYGNDLLPKWGVQGSPEFELVQFNMKVQFDLARDRNSKLEGHGMQLTTNSTVKKMDSVGRSWDALKPINIQDLVMFEMHRSLTRFR